MSPKGVLKEAGSVGLSLTVSVLLMNCINAAKSVRENIMSELVPGLDSLRVSLYDWGSLLCGTG